MTVPTNKRRRKLSPQIFDGFVENCRAISSFSNAPRRISAPFSLSLATVLLSIVNFVNVDDDDDRIFKRAVEK